MSIYFVDNAGALTGPVELDVIPGFGVSVPSNAVELKNTLPPAQSGMCWVLVDGQAKLLQDNRGQVYDKETGSAVQFDRYGPLPSNLTPIPRPAVGYVWSTEGWIKDSTYWYEQAMQQINQACETEITSGCWSVALGEKHLYSSELEDQLNLAGMVLAGIDGPYACFDVQGEKDFRFHTSAQISQVGNDLVQFKLRLLQKAHQLKQQLSEALLNNDIAAIEAVTWEQPKS